MGKGARPEFWVAVVKPGRVMFEIAELQKQQQGSFKISNA